MAINVSILDRSILPRTRSLILGCVTPKSAAACAWVKPRASINLLRRIMRSDRTLRFVASSAENPRSRDTLPLERLIFVVIGPPASGHGDESGRRDAFGPARSQPEASAASASRRRGARKRLLRTSRRRRRDALRVCARGSRRRLAPPWSSASNRWAGGPVAPCRADIQRRGERPREMPGGPQATNRARTRVSQAQRTIYVFI